MAFVIEGKTYTPAPEGVWDAVCVDVADLGFVETQFGEKHKCRLVFELSCKMEDGRPFTVMQQFTVSLHEKATLTKFLKQWRGRPFTAEELRGFDLEKVIGANCKLVITHEERDGTVYGNISAVMKADPRNKLAPTGNYVRYKDREPRNGDPTPTREMKPATTTNRLPAPHPRHNPPEAVEETELDDIPF